MHSRFLQLFKRGRYVSSLSIAREEAKSESPERKHEERERFAVAAVAFCLKYDNKFRKHFLRAVAPMLTAQDIAVVNVEPQAWGDLVLEGPRHALVLEFKLGALLGEHQDPAKPRFSSEGYGLAIRKKYGKAKEVRYIIVGLDLGSGRTKRGIEHVSVPWRSFLHSEPESPMEADLFDCLGSLGASVFIGRNMKNKNLSTQAFGAMEVYQLLHHAARNFAIGSPVSGTDCVGINLRSKCKDAKSRHATLEKLVKPKGSNLGWIGYEDLDAGVCLSVWFYCSAKRSGAMRARLEQLKLGNVTDDRDAVGIFRPSIEESDHMQWFENVLSLKSAT